MMRARLHRLPPLCLALLAAVWLAGCSGFLATPEPRFNELLLQGEGEDKILMIDIAGPITNQATLIPNVGVVPGMVGRIRQELEIAFQDPQVRGLLLRINSPGGTLTDSDVIYNLLTEFKRSKRVKIVASLGDLAASGAVYVAMAADEIYAHPTTLTGSIGVVMPHMDLSGLMDKLGVESDPIKTGEFKDIESPFRPRTDQEQQMLQKIADHLHEKFVNVIVENREEMDTREVRDIADGRLLSADEAAEAGLIDGVRYLDQTYQRLSEIAGFPENRLVRYSNVFLTGKNIYSNASPVEFGN